MLSIASIILGGCAVKLKKTQAPTLSGVFKTFDRGETWQHKIVLAVPGGVSSIRDANIKIMRIDPQDNNAIYLGTENRGLFYSYNGGEYWQQPTQLNSGKINDIAIDPRNKCIIYAAYGNKVVKSTDCNRSWFDAYIDPRPKIVTSIAIDNLNPSNIYISTDFGEIIKSVDGANTWTTVNRFSKSATQVIINTNSTNILYAVVLDQGIFRSDDGGISWNSVSESIKKNKGIFTNARLAFDNSVSDGVYSISKYGIIRSDDGGKNWEILNLITPPLSTDIYSFAINPKNAKQIYYGTASTLYRSNDRGVNWNVKKLPSNSAATYILIDTVNPSILYLGAKKFEEKK